MKVRDKVKLACENNNIKFSSVVRHDRNSVPNHISLTRDEKEVSFLMILPKFGVNRGANRNGMWETDFEYTKEIIGNIDEFIEIILNRFRKDKGE